MHLVNGATQVQHELQIRQYGEVTLLLLLLLLLLKEVGNARLGESD